MFLKTAVYLKFCKTCRNIDTFFTVWYKNYTFHSKYIQNQRKKIIKNHFLFYITYLSVTVSKILEWPHLHFKIVSGQAYYFDQIKDFRSLWAIEIANESNWIKKKHLRPSTLCMSVKVSKFQNWPRPKRLLKLIILLKKTFSDILALNYSQWK